MINSTYEREAAFTALTSACGQLINTKLILTAQKISWVLGAVASNDILVKMVSECMAGFDYQRELSDAFILIDGRTRFRLPPLPKKAVALFVSMLYDFDNGVMNFVEFITGSFPGVRTEDCYKSFTDNVVAAFLERAKTLIFASDERPADDRQKLDEQTKLTVSVIRERSEAVVSQMHRLVTEYALPDSENAHFMIDGLAYALEQKDIKMIKIAFLGLKRYLQDYNMFYGVLSEAEALLRMYSVR